MLVSRSFLKVIKMPGMGYAVMSRTDSCSCGAYNFRRRTFNKENLISYYQNNLSLKKILIEANLVIEEVNLL